MRATSQLRSTDNSVHVHVATQIKLLYIHVAQCLILTVHYIYK